MSGGRSDTGGTPMTEDALAARLAIELAGKTAHLELVLQPASVFRLTGLVQLACRHPGVSEDVRVFAGKLLANVRDYFADCPTALELVRRGDDPSEDR
jgi:hypothetical protein